MHEQTSDVRTNFCRTFFGNLNKPIKDFIRVVNGTTYFKRVVFNPGILNYNSKKYGKMP